MALYRVRMVEHKGGDEMKNKYGVGPDAMEHTMQILVDEVKTLGAQRDALLAACKAALPVLKNRLADARAHENERDIEECPDCYSDLAPEDLCVYHQLEYDLSTAIESIDAAIAKAEANK